jgi:hypothetical protein
MVFYVSYTEKREKEEESLGRDFATKQSVGGQEDFDKVRNASFVSNN